MTSLRCAIRKKKAIHMSLGFPDGAGVKNSPASAGDKRDLGLIPGSGRSPGEGHGTPLQHSCLGNPMDRGAWWATVHGVEKGQTRLKHVCTHSQMNLLIKQKQTHRLRELSYGCWGEGWGDGMDRYTLLYLNWITNKDLLWASLVAQRIKRLPTMKETRVRSLGWEDPLEKEMATHSSTLAWRIPWTEEPGGLQSMGSHRVGHD